MSERFRHNESILSQVIMVAGVVAGLYWVADSYYVMALQESAYAVSMEPLGFYDALALHVPAHAVFGRLGVLLCCLLGGWATAWFVYRWQRRMSEIEVASREGRLRLAEASAGLSVWEYDANTDSFVHDASWPSLLGYKPDEFDPDAPELDLHQIVHPDDWQKACEARHRHLRGQSDWYECDLRARGKSGDWIWLHAYGQVSSELSFDGNRYMVGTHCNITERHEAAEGIRQREQRFRLLFTNSPVGIVEQDWCAMCRGVKQSAESANLTPAVFLQTHPDAVAHFFGQAQSIEANDAAAQLFEADSTKHLLGNLALVLTTESLLPLGRMLAAVLEGTPRYSCDLPLRTLSGHDIEVDIRVTRIPDEERCPVILSFVDLTQRKLEEEERRRDERGMAHRQRLQGLGVLAGGIAHDFNNLLVGIVGNADLALTRVGTDEILRHCLSGVMMAGRSATELCRQMLTYAGKSPVLLDSMDLNQVAKKVHSMVHGSISAKSRVLFELSPEAPTMHGDASQVEQVVLNLIMNAADAIGDAGGDIILRTGMTECTPEILAEYEGGEELTPGTYAYLEVADNGCGMSEETMRQVFEPFFTTKYSGHGLGMAAVIGIMRGHHGAIQVRSQLGVGTTFLAIFPAAKSTNEEPTPSDLAPLQHQSENWTGEGTVLFAEDMDNVQDVGRRILELLGFSVVCVHDGGEAIAVFAKSPDLFKRVILDLSMPVVDGIETWAEMRRIKPDVSVILCSGHGRREILQRVAPHRPAGIIEKPYEILAIQRCLRSLDEAEVEAGVVQEPVH